MFSPAVHISMVELYFCGSRMYGKRIKLLKEKAFQEAEAVRDKRYHRQFLLSFFFKKKRLTIQKLK